MRRMVCIFAVLPLLSACDRAVNASIIAANVSENAVSGTAQQQRAEIRDPMLKEIYQMRFVDPDDPQRLVLVKDVSAIVLRYIPIGTTREVVLAQLKPFKLKEMPQGDLLALHETGTGLFGTNRSVSIRLSFQNNRVSGIVANIDRTNNV